MARKSTARSGLLCLPINQAEYGEIVSIIERARGNAFRAVNHELISMYWEIGAYVSDKIKNGSWGKSVVADFAKYIQTERPDIKGFSASNIWRMRQFYEAYNDNEKLAPLVREISWTQNIIKNGYIVIAPMYNNNRQPRIFPRISCQAIILYGCILCDRNEDSIC
ncbi:MAG: DUF1016 N-terminal domain-containing protein [Clostridiales bacterium]|nr:DUF1016 N-terminal domain-containing protein [Clostridiales bacterium]